MSTLSRAAPWLCRLVLTLFTFLMTMICFKFMSNPVGAAAGFGLAPTSSLGATTLRIGWGVFPIGFALVGLSCLLTSRFIAGLSFVAIFMGLILCVRFYAGMTGGIMVERTFILYAEGAFLVLSLLGIFLERQRQRAE